VLLAALLSRQRLLLYVLLLLQVLLLQLQLLHGVCRCV
jgi:hypothetical protein